MNLSNASSSQYSSSASSTQCSSSGGEDGDVSPIQPEPDRVQEVAYHSQRYWSELKHRSAAASMSADKISLNTLIYGIPKFPDECTEETLNGYASWRLDGCKLDLYQRRGSRYPWTLTRDQPTMCEVTEHRRFCFADEKAEALPLFFLGWCYIFSVALLERRRQPICYTEEEETSTETGAKTIKVHLGHATAVELKWWTKATSSSAITTLTPWSVRLHGNIRFHVTADLEDEISASGISTACSSEEAMQYMAKLAATFPSAGQLTLALAMASSLPLFNLIGAPVQLPTMSDLALNSKGSPDSPAAHELYEKLPYLMTLGWNPHFLASAAYGVFWEPGIQCNLVDTWLYSPLSIARDLVTKGNFEQLAHLFALHRPSIAPLWYGILAFGGTKISLNIPLCLRGGMPAVPFRPLPEVAFWTSSAQSFMDNPLTPYVFKDEVAREAVWRLRYDTCNDEPSSHPFRNYPLCPWPPFGNIPVRETDLSVRAHLDCQRHKWVYWSWTWVRGNGDEMEVECPPDILRASPPKLEDALTGEGCSYVEHAAPPLPLLKSERMMGSDRATGEIFRWMASDMEPSGKKVYSHPSVHATKFAVPGEPMPLVTGPKVAALSNEAIELWLSTMH
ncbi:hypothetical protein B0I35DRAFT_196066 [Stachybotrys elegans]|uniref:Uncharacterized protein n=1 Tax=Stachybotrys elegans TaxID=80388 RepID=A0A8K0SA62_9HYPO|nr:hypothetical protein B0I35DRAFT_196066 [Stachybotrys elegans]